jgi:hypothetical protein
MLYPLGNMKMGTRNSGKRLYQINKLFFRDWTSQMAYILGFTCADGNVHGRTLAWDLTDKYISNLQLLKSFNIAMGSNYPIRKKTNSFRLRVSAKEILEDIKKLGVIPNKKKVLIFPDVEKEYLSHFIRGFLEGDGWIITRIRKNGGKEISVGFSNGSRDFMKRLAELLSKNLGLKNYNLRKREKRTKGSDVSFCYQLEYYSNRADKILDFLYGSIDTEDLVLNRKYEKMILARRAFLEQEKLKKLGRKLSKFEERGGDVVFLIKRCLNEENLIPREISENLGISLSSLYRFMDRWEIRKLEKRGSKEWSRRIIKSRKLGLSNG